MTAHRVRKPLVGLVTAVALATAGSPLSAMAAAGQASEQRRPDSQQASVSTARSERLSLDVNRLSTALGGLPVDIEKMRKELVGRARARVKTPEDEMLARRAEHALGFLDILTAKSASERHTKIRRLPVQITRSASTKGPSGTVQTFSVDGKPTLEIFIPSTPAGTRSGSGVEIEQPSGPFAPSAMDDCYDGPEPCISQEEMDDLGIVIAQAQADVDQGWNDYYAGCQISPGDCQAPVEMLQLSGPSDGPRCSSCAAEAGNAVVALVTGAASLGALALGHSAAAAAGLTLTTAGAVVTAGVVAGIGFGIGYFVGYWGACVYYAMAPVTMFDACSLDPFEAVPVFGSR